MNNSIRLNKLSQINKTYEPEHQFINSNDEFEDYKIKTGKSRIVILPKLLLREENSFKRSIVSID